MGSDDIVARDAVVVGAGIIGISVAAYLSEAGLNVTVIDRTGICEETSSGNQAALAFTDILPLATKGMVTSVPGWLSDPQGPLHIPFDYLPALAPWLLRFFREGWADRRARSVAAQTAMMKLAEAEMLGAARSRRGVGHRAPRRGHSAIRERTRAERVAPALEAPRRGRHSLRGGSRRAGSRNFSRDFRRNSWPAPSRPDGRPSPIPARSASQSGAMPNGRARRFVRARVAAGRARQEGRRRARRRMARDGRRRPRRGRRRVVVPFHHGARRQDSARDRTRLQHDFPRRCVRSQAPARLRRPRLRRHPAWRRHTHRRLRRVRRPRTARPTIAAPA